MSNPTPVLALPRAVDTDNAENYLTVGLAAALVTLDGAVVTARSTPKNNTAHAVQLVHPDATDITYDTSPLASLFIARPPTKTTRNFVSGIWVETDGNAIDKGRGITVHNYGQSDAIYVQLDNAGTSGGGLGSGGTGVAVVANGDYGAGLVSAVGTQNSVACFLESGPGGGGANLLQVSAQGLAGIQEMARWNAGLATGKTGIIFRMAGAGNNALVVRNAADTMTVFQVAADTGSVAISNTSSAAGLSVSTLGSLAGLVITDTGVSGASIKLVGSGGATPSKTLRVRGGVFEIVNDAYTTPIFQMTDGGAATFYGNVTFTGSTGIAGSLVLTTQTLSAGATAGANGAPPAQVAQYLNITVNGTSYKVPMYLV